MEKLGPDWPRSPAALARGPRVIQWSRADAHERASAPGGLAPPAAIHNRGPQISAVQIGAVPADWADRVSSPRLDCSSNGHNAA
ncbi:hypothetical protein R5R35_008897 [Gryllus longicercus]|uniref:Uncharacterized protein n=1 Tax=Gryllus longicercus TaxID=2509291 RepID=A0AAN9Z3I6_9ORTH